jgi:hypothetical protein
MKPNHYYLLPAALFAATLSLTARADTRIGLDLHLGVPAPIVVREAPPRPVIVETQYAAPGPGYVWIAGHNVWMNGRWVWVAGTWALPPQPGAFYVEGRWDERSRNWIEAHWELGAPPPPPGPQVIVEAPPPPRHEHRGYAPGPEYVWIDGYWAWHGGHHEWVGGRWERPPHGRREWVAPRWERHGGSYVFIEGSWR